MGLTSDKNFESSTEYYRKGDATRTIAYGRTREEIVAMLQGAHGTQVDWEWDWIVTERKVKMGLGPMWARATRRYDEYGERV